ncbi:hypothetical protein [Bradyrhizobium sp. sGM-13]|nr:hypothetical protein [Bradyrhizobium sp. sGM-13]
MLWVLFCSINCCEHAGDVLHVARLGRLALDGPNVRQARQWTPLRCR